MKITSIRAFGAIRKSLWFVTTFISVFAAGYSADSFALPAFARQTGQNCVACHAGGNFPELTSYGRMFKLTGYTLGERTIPLSAMAVVSGTKMRNTNNPNPAGDPRDDFPMKNGDLIVSTGSIFLAGKITDNIGGFYQATYNTWNTPDKWTGSWASDNADFRYADRFIDPQRDVIFGMTLNNNPTAQDPWNSAPAWGFDVAPGSAWGGSYGKIPASPLVAGGLAQQVLGIGGYVYWDKTIYAELAGYQSTNNKAFTYGNFNASRISGTAPYGRVAYTVDWGGHSLMFGALGMSAKLHNDPTDSSSPTTQYNDWGLDAQYQYILDPHTFTAQVSYLNEHIKYDSGTGGQPGAYDSNSGIANSGANTGTNAQSLTNSSDTLNLFRIKGSYVYRATYGGSLSYFGLHGSSNSAYQMGVSGDPTGLDVNGSPTLFSVANNVTGKQDTTGWTAEAFVLPLQYARIGLQYTMFSKYLGASSNYDGWGRNAKDNNTLFFYVWGAY
jgi:hypothetical protein